VDLYLEIDFVYRSYYTFEWKYTVKVYHILANNLRSCDIGSYTQFKKYFSL